MFCVIRYRSVRRADHSSRGVLPSVVCLTECDHECGAIGPLGMSRNYIIYQAVLLGPLEL